MRGCWHDARRRQQPPANAEPDDDDLVDESQADAETLVDVENAALEHFGADLDVAGFVRRLEERNTPSAVSTRVSPPTRPMRGPNVIASSSAHRMDAFHRVVATRLVDPEHLPGGRAGPPTTRPSPLDLQARTPTRRVDSRLPSWFRQLRHRDQGVWICRTCWTRFAVGSREALPQGLGLQGMTTSSRVSFLISLSNCSA
jgi:hypothetical protein